MNVEQITQVVNNIIDVLALVAVTSPVVISGLKWLQAHTQDKRIKVLESYALRTVQAVEQIGINMTPSDKKKLAAQKMQSYISESKLKFNVTADQVSDLIEQAVNTVKDDTSKGIAKENQTAVPETHVTPSDVLTAEQEADLKEMKKVLSGEE